MGAAGPVRNTARLIMTRTYFFFWPPCCCRLLHAGVGQERGHPPPDPKAQMGALESRIAILVEEHGKNWIPKARRWRSIRSFQNCPRPGQRHGGQELSRPCRPQWRTSASLLMQQDEKWQGLLGENLAAQHYTKQSGRAVDDSPQRFWTNG